ncbi:hypothetical protein AB0C18_09115 [Nonomuraea muscovyensis]|uniref:hypothetical protein n=1 Tax=Nonomuraea muscovyensis TaxID=1124761 RepID=UPI0033CD5EA1
MRFVKPLAVGLLGATMLAVPFSGVSLAATGTDGSRPAAPNPARYAQAVGDHVSGATVTVSAVGLGDVAGQVVAGQKYQVKVTSRGSGKSGVATLKTPQGKAYRLRLVNGSATKTLTLPRTTKPGRYRLSVVIGGKITTVECVVTRQEDARRAPESKRASDTERATGSERGTQAHRAA